VICAFALGLVGAVGWIWLQSAKPAVAHVDPKTNVEAALSEAILSLRVVNFGQGSYAVSSLRRFVDEPTNGNWLVVQTDFKRVWKAVEQAKDAIVLYNATAPRPVDFSSINEALSKRQALIGPYLTAMPPSDPTEVVLLWDEYKVLARKLGPQIEAILRQVRTS
jgi:hypothetical protein